MDDIEDLLFLSSPSPSSNSASSSFSSNSSLTSLFEVGLARPRVKRNSARGRKSDLSDSEVQQAKELNVGSQEHKFASKDSDSGPENSNAGLEEQRAGAAEEIGNGVGLGTFTSNSVPGTESVFVKTFGCSHNLSDSEYMTGQLAAFGYSIVEKPEDAHLWIINTCTVKNPSQSAMDTWIKKGQALNKRLVVAGCVPQGDSSVVSTCLSLGISIVGVESIHRIVEVVEAALKGHAMAITQQQRRRRRGGKEGAGESSSEEGRLPSLHLPKVRKNRLIEIIPISVGCLGKCGYCKTKHARGHLGSYPLSELVQRARDVIQEGVKEIWLSSEDTGAYGIDLGTSLPSLLSSLVSSLPSDLSVMLRVGMTNPPYILQHLDQIAGVLCHPSVFSFLHVPVQSGSNSVLDAMQREYTVEEFERVVDVLRSKVNGLEIATDVICGYPGETDEDFERTIRLVEKYKFAQLHISQFYPRPGTPAARMKKVPSSVVKERSRRLTCIFEKFRPYEGMEGKEVQVWANEIAADGKHLVCHTKSYIQLLLPPEQGCPSPSLSKHLGRTMIAKVKSVGRWSVFGEFVKYAINYESNHDEKHAALCQSVGAKQSTRDEGAKREEVVQGVNGKERVCENCSCGKIHDEKEEAKRKGMKGETDRQVPGLHNSIEPAGTPLLPSPSLSPPSSSSDTSQSSSVSSSSSSFSSPPSSSPSPPSPLSPKSSPPRSLSASCSSSFLLPSVTSSLPSPFAQEQPLKRHSFSSFFSLLRTRFYRSFSCLLSSTSLAADRLLLLGVLLGLCGVMASLVFSLFLAPSPVSSPSSISSR